MFVPALPVLEKILRPVIVYFFLVIGLRLAGKRELAQLNPFDLVVLLTLSNTVQNAIIGEDNSVTGGIIGATALLVVNYLVVRFLYGHQGLDQIVEGEPMLLIENGTVNERLLGKELITPAELEAAAHRQGFASLEEIACGARTRGHTLLPGKETGARRGAPPGIAGAPRPDDGGDGAAAEDAGPAPGLGGSRWPFPIRNRVRGEFANQCRRRPLKVTATPARPITIPRYQKTRRRVSRVIDVITSATSRKPSPKSKRSAFLRCRSRSFSTSSAWFLISFLSSS